MAVSHRKRAVSGSAQDREIESNRIGALNPSSVSHLGSPLRQVGMGSEEKVKHIEECSVANALGTWVFSVAGALIAIPVGIKRKSLAPLVFYGTTGTMLDIILGITACEREHAERQMQLLESQASLADVTSLPASENEP